MDWTLISETDVSLDLVVAAVTIAGVALGLRYTVRSARMLMRMASTQIWPVLAARWMYRRLRALPAIALGPRLRPGARACLAGVVECEQPGNATLSGVPAVVCWYALGELCGGAVDEGVAAASFVLRLADGTAVRVTAEEAAAAGRLTLADGGRDHWIDERRSRAWYCESRISPGDRIEVAGHLRREVDPRAARLHDRDLPLGWAIVADDQQPLVLAFRTRAPAPGLRVA